MARPLRTAHAAPQRIISHETIQGAVPPFPDVRPNVVPDVSTPSTPLRDVKTHLGPCGPAGSSSSYPFWLKMTIEPHRPDEHVVKSNCHGILGGKLGLMDRFPLYTPRKRERRLRGIALSLLIVILILSNCPSSPLEYIISAMERTPLAFVVLTVVAPGHSFIPSSFPASGKALWYRRPASSWSKEFLPVGNGFLAG